MPNGHDTAYNGDWCKEKHRQIDNRFEQIDAYMERRIKSVWHKINGHDKLMWGTLMAMIANLGGVVAILLKLVLAA